LGLSRCSGAQRRGLKTPVTVGPPSAVVHVMRVGGNGGERETGRSRRFSGPCGQSTFAYAATVSRRQASALDRVRRPPSPRIRSATRALLVVAHCRGGGRRRRLLAYASSTSSNRRTRSEGDNTRTTVPIAARTPNVTQGYPHGRFGVAGDNDPMRTWKSNRP
jgi:hypothetical protein